MMNDKNQGFDFRALFDNIGEAVRTAGNSMTGAVQPASVWSESGLRSAVLTALKGGAKTGHDVIAAIHDSNEWGIKPSTAKVYPLLESLLDENLVTVKTIKDRKHYELTAAGITAEESTRTAGSDGDAPQWPGLHGDLVTASRRLAKVAFDVSQHGTVEQQAAASKAIDDARRALHEILAAK